MEQIACPLCGEHKGTVLHSHDDITALVCEACGMVYLDPRPSAEAIAAFYRDAYQKERNKVSDADAAIERAKNPRLRGKKLLRAEQEFAPLLSRESRVLDIGAGYGGLLAAIKEKTGAYVEGIEPGEIGAEVARRHFGLPVATADLDSFLASPHEPYDCIIMSHVLEHLPQPIDSLRSIRTLLRPRGTLWVAVPNVLWPEDSPERTFHIEHLLYFSPRTLIRTLNKAGYSVTNLKILPKEMVVYAVRSDEATGMDANEAQGSPAHVKAAYAENRRTYFWLSLFRKGVELVLPAPLAHRVRKIASWIFGKLGLIQY